MKNYIIGIDGTKNGWLAVIASPDSFLIEMFDHIEALYREYPEPDFILLDMPMGLPESVREDMNRPEKLLRSKLKGKAASVFNVPCRQAVYAESYQEANARNRACLGKGLSRQSYGICSKIREVDCFIQKYPGTAQRIFESHPELGFAALNGGIPILANKKSELGIQQRISLLNNSCPGLTTALLTALACPDFSRRKDDIIDAACLCVTGLTAGMIDRLLLLPPEPVRDSKGISMRIAY